MKKLTIAYLGSPDFSANFLEKILTDKDLLRLIKIQLVFTQPDKPAGRKQILTPTPVKKIALKYKIPLLEISDLKIIKNFKLKISKTDIALVYAYASIIPQELLNIPKYGFWCIHPSLLPRYRGTSPMATVLINGDKETGVTIIKMDEKIDHGPIIAQEKYQILPTDKRPDLEKKLTNLAFNMFKKIVIKLTSLRINDLEKKNNKPVNPLNSLILKSQQHQLATYTKKLTKNDGFFDFKNLKLEIKKSSEKLFNLFRGLYPWPGIWTILPNGKRLKIIDLTLDNQKIKINRVQLEGKKEVDFETFNKAYKFFTPVKYKS